MINSQDALSEDYFLSEESYIRDRIVVLGRRSSGKTVFLSALYSKLWNTPGSLRIKALKGASHVEFMKTVEDIKADVWPPATQGISENILELTHNEQKRTIVALDYPGEVFTNAFVKEIESNETNVLIDHIDHAQALIVLIDPEHIVKGDLHSKIDNNYGLLQAINRIQNWPDGQEIPIVLILTKADKYYHYVKSEGGTRNFIVKHLSQLVRDVHGIKGCAMSAYACVRDSSMNNNTVEIDAPLLYCLERIQQNEHKKDEQRKKQRFHHYISKIDEQDKKRTVRMNAFIYAVSIIAFVLLIILTNKILPSTVWHNLWHNTLGRIF